MSRKVRGSLSIRRETGAGEEFAETHSRRGGQRHPRDVELTGGHISSG